MPTPWFQLVGRTLTILGSQSIMLATDGPFSGPLNPHMTGHVVWSDPIYVPTRLHTVTWVGTFAPAPKWGGNCFRWWTPVEAGLQPGLPWTMLATDVSLVIPSDDITIRLPEGNLWVITAYYCPDQHPNREERIILDTRCRADMDLDGGVTIDDLTLFLHGYGEGNIPAVDVDDGSGTGTPDGGVDIDDLLFFLAHYEAGC